MTASDNIDALIGSLADWRGETLAAVRAATLAADPAIVEEWKWMGSPTWSCAGLIGVANAHKAHVKLTFQRGAEIEDRGKLFNAGLDGNARRAIDWREGDAVDGPPLTALVRAAIALNRAKAAAKATAKATAKPRR